MIRIVSKGKKKIQNPLLTFVLALIRYTSSLAFYLFRNNSRRISSIFPFNSSFNGLDCIPCEPERLGKEEKNLSVSLPCSSNLDSLLLFLVSPLSFILGVLDSAEIIQRRKENPKIVKEFGGFYFILFSFMWMELDGVECVSSSDGIDDEDVTHHHHPFSKPHIINGHGNGTGISPAISPATSVHELLECPVCTNSMYPPIHQVCFISSWSFLPFFSLSWSVGWFVFLGFWWFCDKLVVGGD